MPKRNIAVVTTVTPPAYTTPRAFAGGHVVCRNWNGAFDSGLASFDTPARSMPAAMVGNYALKTNVTIWAAGPIIAPAWHESDFEVSYVISGVSYAVPSTRFSRTNGLLPYNYNTDWPQSYFGQNVNGMQTVTNGLLVGIAAIPTDATVAIRFENNSQNLVSDVQYAVNLTGIGCAATPDQITVVNE